MATTLVAVLLRHDRVVVAHVGDSRCYLMRRGEINSLTRDHTMANEQVRLGVISRQEADEGETRHLLSRSLGGGLFVSVETEAFFSPLAEPELSGCTFFELSR